MEDQTQWEEEMTPEQVQDFWNKDLTDVKEERVLIPPTQNAVVSVTETELLNKFDDDVPRPWKMLKVKFRLEEGISVGDTVKYKGSILNSDLICYYADKNKYDYNKPFFGKGQFLIELKKLIMACDIESPKLVVGGLTDEAAQSIANNLKGKKLLLNIKQRKRQVKNEEGKYVDSDELENAVVNFKKLPESMSV